MLSKAPKGTRDILPQDIYKWQYVEREFIKLCKCYGFNEIRIPVFEHTEVFKRGVGDTTDIVQKEMYTFNDKGDRSITLRPEGTAGVVRSYIENGMASLPQPVKLAYNITCYRYENVQKGRYREFHQFGLEAFGSASAKIDAEIISLLDMYLKKLGIKNVKLNINSIGCPTCRAKFNEMLKDYFRPNIDKMCDSCKDRIEKNPLRIIDCKEEKCKEFTKDAPALLDFICDECKDHFEELKSNLDALGIEYNINKTIVRGLDYYTKTVFEFVSENVGTQGTICGGGRYDGLVQQFGGKETPGVGFAMGVERLLMEIESQGIEIPNDDFIDLYVVSMCDEANIAAAKLANALRSKEIKVEKDLLDRSFKAQMKAANKLNAKFVALIGEDELEKGIVQLKNMETGEQEEQSLENIDDLINKLRRNI